MGASQWEVTGRGYPAALPYLGGWQVLVAGEGAERHPGAELHEGDDGARQRHKGRHRLPQAAAGPRVERLAGLGAGVDEDEQAGEGEDKHGHVGRAQDDDVDEAGGEGTQLVGDGLPSAWDGRESGGERGR